MFAGHRPQGKTELDLLRPAAAQTLPVWAGSLEREFTNCVRNAVIMVTKKQKPNVSGSGYLRTVIKARWLCRPSVTSQKWGDKRPTQVNGIQGKGGHRDPMACPGGRAAWRSQVTSAKRNRRVKGRASGLGQGR